MTWNCRTSPELPPSSLSFHTGDEETSNLFNLDRAGPSVVHCGTKSASSSPSQGSVIVRASFLAVLAFALSDRCKSSFKSESLE